MLLSSFEESKNAIINGNTSKHDAKIADDALYNVFCDLERAAKTQDQVNKAKEIMRCLMIEFCGENKINNTHDGETSFYGKINTTQ